MQGQDEIDWTGELFWLGLFLGLLGMLAGLLACTPPEPVPVPKDVWQALTAERCAASCGVLPVAFFAPGCARKNGGKLYCDGYPSVTTRACICGAPAAAAPPAEVRDDGSPSLITPVLVHHGLKLLLGH